MIKNLKRKLSFFFIGTTTFFFTIIMVLMAYFFIQSYANNIQVMNKSVLSYIQYDLNEYNGELSLDDLQEKYSFSTIEIIDYTEVSISILESGVASSEADEERIITSPEYGGTIISYSINDDGSAYIIATEGNNDISTFSIELATPDDDIFTRNIVIVLLIYIAGVICIVLLCHIFVKTALHPLEESLLMQNEFITSVSHEFRNPLAVIQNSANLVMAVHGDELGKQAYYLDNITDECTQLSKLLDTMLSYISFNQKTIDIHKEIIPFEDFLISIYPLLTEKCRAKEMLIDVKLPEDYSLPEIEMNKSQLTELFINLVDNAVSFSPAKSTIIIRSYLNKKTLCVEVIDEGSGMSKTDKKMAFETFYCGDKSRSNKEHFGLGLSIAKDIAANHHARIKLLDSPGGGCLVKVIFPLPKP